MRTILRILCLLAVSCTASAQTVKPNDVHQLGAVAVTIPPPPGFEQVPGSDPRVAGTSVLAVFVPPGIQVLGSAAAPRLGAVDTLPDMRETDVTAADFAALKASVRMPSVVDGIAAAMQLSMSPLMPVNVGMTPIPIRSLGVIDDDRNSVSVAFAWGAQGQGIAVLSVMSTTMLFIRGRLLETRLVLVGISTEDAGKKEITDLARSWAQAIVSSNAAPR